MLTTLQNQEPKGQKELTEVVAALSTIAAAKQVEQQRAELSKLSDAFWSILTASEQFGLPAYYDYCPMKKSHWISETSAIRNPFYGKQMLTCGKVEKGTELK